MEPMHHADGASVRRPEDKFNNIRQVVHDLPDRPPRPRVPEGGAPGRDGQEPGPIETEAKPEVRTVEWELQFLPGVEVPQDDLVDDCPGEPASISREGALRSGGPQASGLLEDGSVGARVPDLKSIRADLGEPRTVVGDGDFPPAEATGVLPDDPILLEVMENDGTPVVIRERD